MKEIDEKYELALKHLMRDKERYQLKLLGIPVTTKWFWATIGSTLVIIYEIITTGDDK